MRFEFSTASRIIFGPGTSIEIPGLASQLGSCAFVVTDSQKRAAPLLDALSAIEMPFASFIVPKEPDVETIILATRIYQESSSDLVIGLGGGAALDSGKAVAALAANPGTLLDYLEIVGAGKSLIQPSAPFIAVPTTAGTGSEVTRNAVISVPEKRLKVSLRSPLMLPCIAVVDPKLTRTLPPDITASTGLDALTQLIEPFVSNAANPLIDSLCRDGIIRVARSLFRAYTNGRDDAAREDMSLAGLYGGLALSNSRLGAVHGLAGPIGGMYPAPHGVICGRLLPLVMEANLQALQKREPGSLYLERFAEVARLLSGDPLARAEDGCIWVHRLVEKLHIPPLSVFGLKQEEYHTVASRAQKSSSMKGNPIVLTIAEIIAILEKAA
jgi:alcohol dehydrogenase class IV